MDRKQALYRFYGDGGQLLYVGITANPGHRLTQHAAQKSWWSDVRGVSIEWYASREEVAAAERRAIALEKPLHNIVRPALHVVSTAERRCGHCFYCRHDEPCALYSPREPDDDDPPVCRICRRTDCLYALGYEDGEPAGWVAAYDRYASGDRTVD